MEDDVFEEAEGGPADASREDAELADLLEAAPMAAPVEPAAAFGGARPRPPTRRSRRGDDGYGSPVQMLPYEGRRF